MNNPIPPNPQENLQIVQPKNFNPSTLDKISEELVWLENFPSKATRDTYKARLKKLCEILSIQSIEQLREVKSIHIIKFRDTIKAMDGKNNSINTGLSAISSLFKHLIEKQIVKTNPVYGVKTMKKDYRKVKSRALSDEEVKAGTVPNLTF